MYILYIYNILYIYIYIYVFKFKTTKVRNVYILNENLKTHFFSYKYFDVFTKSSTVYMDQIGRAHQRYLLLNSKHHKS